MSALAPGTNYYGRIAHLLAIGLFLLALPRHAVGADSGPQVQLDVSKAGPRKTVIAKNATLRHAFHRPRPSLRNVELNLGTGIGTHGMAR